MKPIEAIRTATLEAAALVGFEGKAGSIESQYFADIIAVEGNPLESAGVMSRVRFVMKDGKVYRNDWAQQGIK
jgi:imidazolonepropionase-like amidohydrolase